LLTFIEPDFLPETLPHEEFVVSLKRHPNVAVHLYQEVAQVEDDQEREESYVAPASNVVGGIEVEAEVGEEHV